MIRFLPYLFALVLTWNYPTGFNVQFNVYEQTVSAPKPYWTTDGRNLVCDIVTTDQLTNGWKLVATVPGKRYVIPDVRDDNVIHAFIVTATQKSTGLESDPSTK